MEEVFIELGTFHKGDEGRAPEADATLMTMDLYEELFFGPNPTNDTWVFVVTINDTSRGGKMYSNSPVKDVLSIFRLLAHERQGTGIRFGYWLDGTIDCARWNLITDSLVLPKLHMIEPNPEGGFTMTEGMALMY